MIKTRARQNLVYIAFVAPAALFFTLIVLVPFVRAIVFSFQDWNGISSNIRWAGWSNYAKLLQDTGFMKSFAFTAKFVVITTVLLNLFGLLLALVLNMALKSRNVLRTAFFLPYVIGPVIIGFIWQFIITQLFGEIGAATGWTLFMKNWLSLPNYAFWSLVIVTVWHSVGYFMIIYLAALQGVPKDMLEAAEIDGAGKGKQLWHVVLPLIRPAMTINLFLAISNGFKGFDLNFALTRGGPFGATESLALHIYLDAFTKNLFTYASAKAVVFFLVLASVTLIQVAIMKRREVEM
ncbi:carbohydrate ABC transporter permease [Paenibacillus allorhizosphaerae]|uniref:Melibiose/raffinose/stachyose import permease protein MelD n=1 Tax=Paenibacillus allorhizosphaerae TaxID=2849866 RepID=A0ABM8VK49_9BACL|nr:sugar ABC transporter permease [Paenibacillus allorhizosphaerae]CAG7646495.1 Melibiose/raffinose/stachyose import permease protein MelD [Paenibacillus allorhizosphaerae]